MSNCSYNRLIPLFGWIAVVCFMGALMVGEAWASDASARAKYNEAVSLYEVKSYYQQQRAIILLLDAYNEAESDSFKDSILTQLRKTDALYDELVEAQMPFFADTPKEQDEYIYDRLAAHGDARANRLKGLLLLERDDDSGMNYLYKADEKGDLLAAATIAKCYAYGKHGCKRDAQLAWDWLQRGVSLGGLNAYTDMAEILWDGDGNWNAPCNLAESVKFLEIVESEFRRWKMGDENEERGRQASLLWIEEMLKIMRVWRDAPGAIEQAGGYTNFMPSSEAILHACQNEKLMWFYLHGINEEFKRFGGTYKMPPGSQVDINLIKLEVGGTGGNQLGVATRRYDGTTVRNKIEIFYDSLPPYQDTSQSFWRRQMVLVDTMTHELAHVYFSQRYPNIAEVSDVDCKRLYEGHATNVAYEFVNDNYFRGRLSPDSYAEIFLSNEYKRYFFWFRDNCLWPSGLVQWDKLDRWERDASKGKEVYTRKQVEW